MNRLYVFCVACLAVFAIALGSCKKDDGLSGTSINIDAITEDNALEEADKIIDEIDKL